MKSLQALLDAYAVYNAARIAIDDQDDLMPSAMALCCCS
jgi:hypothetical protein